MTPNLSFATLSPTIREPFKIGFCDNKFKPEPNVPESLSAFGAFLVTKLTAPPMASASMEGRMALFTSID